MNPSPTANDILDLVLRDELQTLWQDKDVFAEVQKLDGEIARAVPGRETRRFELHGKTYYRKLHTGVGWGEIFKNLLQLRLPIISAENEWQALNRLANLNVPSLTPVAYGKKFRNPAAQLSFIVTRELTGTIELDKYLVSCREQRLTFNATLMLVQEVARIARVIHCHGINHRDLYLCHFLLDLRSVDAWRAGIAKPILYLVDLHRAQLRDRVPARWLIKDLASIYFSVMDFGITRRDIFRFLMMYFDQPVRTIFSEKASLLRHIAQRADKLYQREQRLRARGLRN